jgi:RNA polymerase sigma-32 factor
MAHIDDPHTQRANRRYIRKAMAQPILEKEYELNLARKWREDKDEKALHELINAYARLVISMAAKYKNYGLPIGDLIQEGNIGLMVAAERFEPDRALRFSTYASWWIRSQIQDYILRNWSIVRTGTTSAQKSLFFNLRKLRAQIEGKNEQQTLGHDGRKKIADELGVKLKDVETMEQRFARGDRSLNAKIGEDGVTEWQNIMPDDGPSPEDIVIGLTTAQNRSDLLNKSLAHLSQREQKIIRERHLTEETVTLEKLGQELGISKERVRQLESRAMDKMRDDLSRDIKKPDDLLGDAGKMF